MPIQNKVGMPAPPAVLCFHLAVFGALAMVTAQTPPPPPPLLTKTTTNTLSRIVISVAIVTFFILVLICLFVLCAEGHGAGNGERPCSVRRRRRGLAPAALAALPVVTYAEIKRHRSGELECAVCLTAFEDGDELRLLPQCSHAFHPDCIEPWLQVHVTCPLCRTNLEKPAPTPPETQLQTTQQVVAVQVDGEEEEKREEEAVELERLRCVRRAARLQRWHTTGHAPSPKTAEGAPGDHERFTVRLPPHVRAEVVKSRRLRHATSLVVGQNCEGSAACEGGGWRWHGARRRWPSFLARTPSWGRGSTRHVGTATARRPARCKSGNLTLFAFMNKKSFGPAFSLFLFFHKMFFL